MQTPCATELLREAFLFLRTVPLFFSIPPKSCFFPTPLSCFVQGSNALNQVSFPPFSILGNLLVLHVCYFHRSVLYNKLPPPVGSFTTMPPFPFFPVPVRDDGLLFVSLKYPNNEFPTLPPHPCREQGPLLPFLGSSHCTDFFACRGRLGPSPLPLALSALFLFSKPRGWPGLRDPASPFQRSFRFSLVSLFPNGLLYWI